jgi:hypothetical protein
MSAQPGHDVFALPEVTRQAARGRPDHGSGHPTHEPP